MEFEIYYNLLVEYKELSKNDRFNEWIYAYQLKVLDCIVGIEEKIRETEEKIKNCKSIKPSTREEKIAISKEINEMHQGIYELKGYIKKIKSIIDALAYKVFSKYDLKNLTFNSESGFISGKKGLDRELEVLKQIFESGGIAILNDLTNCITIGDISELAEDRINLIEVKTSNGKNNRIIRQEKRRKIHMDHLHNDYIENFLGKQFARIYTYEVEENFICELNELIDQAIEKRVVIEQMEEGLYYAVLYEQSRDDMQKLSIIRDIKSPICFNLNAFKNEIDLTNNPFLNYFYEVGDYLNFLSGDLIICIFVDFDVLNNMFLEKGIKIKRIEDKIWMIELEVILEGKKESILISKHLFNRIGRDFLSLSYFVNSNIEIVEEIQNLIVKGKIKGDKLS